MQLGQRGRDKITGFEGILTARAEYLTGCTQYALTPAVREGKMQDNGWFDEGRIEIVDDGIAEASVRSVANGGPNRDQPNY